MRARTSGSENDFRELRSRYEEAFHQFSLQVHRLQFLTGDPTADGKDAEEARRRVDEAYLAYRERRDMLAQFLLCRERRAGGTEPDRRFEVEQLAYQLWEKAGRPIGMADDHWYLAERLICSGRGNQRRAEEVYCP